MNDLIPKNEVLKRLANISDTTLWRMCRTDQFPKPISISANRKGWRSADVDAWLEARAAAAAPQSIAA